MKATLYTRELKEYSVLLLYPDYMQEREGTQTYYTFIKAPNSKSAAAAAKREVTRQNDMEEASEDDFLTLLVINGHIPGEET